MTAPIQSAAIGLTARTSNRCRPQSYGARQGLKVWAGQLTPARLASRNWVKMGGLLDGGVALCNWMEIGGKMGSAINSSTLEITYEILPLISEIDEFKSAWRAIGRTAPDQPPAIRSNRD